MATYPKGKKEESFRSSRPKRRRFHGNRYTDEDNEPVGQGTSARKLETASQEDVCVKLTHFYRIIEFVSVFAAISELAICKVCKRNLNFEESGTRGLGFKIAVKCACGTRFVDSGPLRNTGYEINHRIVFAMRLLGIGLQGFNLFVSLMDISKGLSKGTYDRVVQHIHECTKVMFDAMCLRVVEQEKKENEKRETPLLDFKVSGNGSWKKRGFTSLYGVTTLIASFSGKVIDLVVKSSYCQACNAWKGKEQTEEFKNWYETHVEECSANHTGSAGKMEVDSIKEMFSASERKYGVRYMNYIGDGDSKTFKAILDLNPYGDEHVVVKSECVNHVEKRMGTRLRNIKKEKKLGGKGKLTDALIKKITKYYGLAIIRNSDSVEDMQRNVMATYWHMVSTDENPKHENCPAGEDSWCKFRVAESRGLEYTHPPPLDATVAKHIFPIFEDLSRKDLLERCLGGHTQNANESFNSTVWRLAPKHLHCGRKIIEIAAWIAAGIFNEGYLSVLKIMSSMDIIIGPVCREIVSRNDENRKKSQERRSRSLGLSATKVAKQHQLERNELLEEEEGLSYGAGIAD